MAVVCALLLHLAGLAACDRSYMYKWLASASPMHQRLYGHCHAQVLGRNLEALVTRAQECKADWKDEFVSVEHMLLAFVDDTRFGQEVIFNKSSDLTKAKLESAIKEIRGTNRVTDQVSKRCIPSTRHWVAHSP